MTTADKFRNYGEAVLTLRRIMAPTATNGEVLRLLEIIGKAERVLNHSNEVACNYGLTPAQESSREKTIEKLRLQLAEYGFGLRVNGDPRGLAVRVVLPAGERGNLWGGEGEWGATWVE